MSHRKACFYHNLLLFSGMLKKPGKLQATAFRGQLNKIFTRVIYKLSNSKQIKDMLDHRLEHSPRGGAPWMCGTLLETLAL